MSIYLACSRQNWRANNLHWLPYKKSIDINVFTRSLFMIVTSKALKQIICNLIYCNISHWHQTWPKQIALQLFQLMKFDQSIPGNFQKNVGSYKQLNKKGTYQHESDVQRLLNLVNQTKTVMFFKPLQFSQSFSCISSTTQLTTELVIHLWTHSQTTITLMISTYK